MPVSPPPPASATTRRSAPAPAGAEVDDLERSLSLVGRAILRLGIPAHALAEGEHVDRSGYWVLHRLDECGTAVRLSDLAALLELDVSTVSRQVRQLVEAGLVTRQPDPEDGRACLLGLSPRGGGVLDAVRQARRDVLRQALCGWRQRDRAALVAALARLADDLPTAAHGCPGADTSARPARPGGLR